VLIDSALLRVHTAL